MTAQLVTVHRRHNASVLAGVEKRTLTWIATRLPGWITSDHLSALGLGAMALAGAAFAAWPLTGWAPIAIVAALALNWFGDSLDGTLARVRDQQRPRYGYYVDHVIDLAGTMFLVLGMAASGLINPLIGIGVLCGYVLVCAETYLATHVTRVFKMSFLGFGPTELRIVLAIGVAKAAATPLVEVPWLGRVLLFDIGGGIAVVGMMIAFAVSAISNTRALYAEEPIPQARSDARAA